MHLTKNYNTDGGDRTVIGGTLEFEQGAEVKNFPGGGSQSGKAENQSASSATAVAGSKGGIWMARKRIRYIGPEAMKIPAGFFCVRKEWEKASTQIGLFKSLDMAVNCAVHNPTYSVFDSNGDRVFPVIEGIR